MVSARNCKSGMYFLRFKCRYCIPMTDECRLFTKAEEKFFAECETYNGMYINHFDNQLKLIK
jgi:hypothetical protein